MDFWGILKLGAVFFLAILLCAFLFHGWTMLSVRLVSALKRLFLRFLRLFRRRDARA